MKTIALHGNFSENMKRALSEKCPEGFTICPVNAKDDEGVLASADYIINRGGAADAEAIRKMKNTKMLQKWGVGYDKIDVQAAGERGIPVAITVGGNSEPVAELTVSLMLAVLRNIVPMAERMKKGEWSRDQFAPRSYLLNGKTVGLLGIGNIAKKVAKILKNGFDCEILYYDVFRMSEEQEKELGYRFVTVDELMAESDIVSIHVPLLDSTAGMINAEKLALMKPTAYLINTARGGVINEPDLIEALKAGKLMGAALDTYASEPLPADSELLEMDNVITTPHCGGNTVDNDINMAAICMENIARYDATGDKSMRCFVNQAFLK